MRCPHKMRPEDLGYHPGGTAYRVETFSPAPRCELLPKKDQFGREYNVIRYVFSGGSPIDAAEECVGRNSPRCPLSSHSCVATGRTRSWYIDPEGVMRWADNDEVAGGEE